ncbi:LOW QUALITY PROTEIN: X-ray radiation resistance-associated protein 1-like [Amphiura filiformis]|uniref:LOW QUALITY PROTEIN: X-ray radiation resistance-associated protein 1-like n=1 Tax=Amphiura filiformis TaxID=82378 RepID=UPI003B21DD43
MAVPVGIKLDDGTNTSFVSKCFPARRVFGHSNDGGAWLVAQRAEQKRHFEAVLNVKPPKTYAQIKAERKQKEKTETIQKETKETSGTQPPPGSANFVEGTVTEGLLDGFFLLRNCCVEDPSDVCSVNISGKELTDAKEEDFTLFDNVAYVNAGENLLPFEAFRNFPIVRELELPLNGLRALHIDLDDYPHLEVLDLSYNNLSKDDLLTLGLLPKLKVLYLTGNQLHSIPADIAKPFKVDAGNGELHRFPRYSNLEILFLDDNQLTDLATFASLAGLKRLKRLNLDKNEIQSVPHLKALSGQHVAIHSDPSSASSTPGRKTSGKGKRRRKSGSRSSSRASSRASTPGKPADDEVEDLKQELEAIASEPASAPGQDLESEVAPAIEPTSVPNEEIERAVKVAALKAALTTESASTFSSTFTAELPPPFPELEHLSLAYNKISEEEALLALAAWPMLKELVIHNNPLTSNNSGDPPLLKRYLQDRLGIQMVRKKPDMTNKPSIQVPTKPHRKVKEIPKPLPKRPLQLMLEAGPDTPALPSSSFQPHPPQMEPRPPSQPLPPIQPSEVHPEEDLFEEKMTRTQSWTEDNFAKAKKDEESTAASAPEAAAKTSADTDEPVFLTQVDDHGEEEAAPPRKPSPPPADQPKKDTKDRKGKKRIDSAAYSMAVPEKFKGYEVFYDANDDPEVPVAHDIQGNLRSLRLALKHPTNYRDNKVDLERLQKPFHPYLKSKLPPKPPHQTKAEKLEDVLEQMKNRLTTEEVNLAKILDNKKKMKEDFPEVTDLLREIQTKYKDVRNATMQDTEVQKQSVEDALNSLHNLGDKLKPSSRSTLKPTATR